MSAGATVELRPACRADAAALERVAGRDSSRVPPGRLLVAEVDGVVSAALALETGAAIADPFTHTDHLVEALRAHAAQIRRRKAWTRPSRPQPAT